MTKAMHTCYSLEVTEFDPHFLEPIYPGIKTIQLEPGTLRGSIRYITAEWLRITSGWLNRTVLFEGRYGADTLNVGFILSADSKAIAHGHLYDAGTISVDLHDSAVHEVFPSGVAWVEISGPRSSMGRHIKSLGRLLRPGGHFTLQGPRSQLEPLIDLVNNSIWCRGNSNPRPRSNLRGLLLKRIEQVLASRVLDGADQQPFVEGDRFRTHVLQAGHQFALEHMQAPLSLDEVCMATGMKPRTLQKYFQEIYGMGPTEYFRTRRLNEIRADLMNPTNTNLKICSVAERWGFTHMGRFAKYYCRLFGETPRQTTRRLAQRANAV